MRAERDPHRTRTARHSPRVATWWIDALLLVVAVAAVFGRTGAFGFTNYDDPEYVYGNRFVLAGVSWASLRWAFTTVSLANWHPLTWLSLQLDVALFGPDPKAMHLVNVALHAASCVVLYVALRRATRARGRSVLVAALFGVHPLHVESVAWIAERKDVLSTLFYFSTILAWIEWVRNRTFGRRALVTILLTLGLLAKPMLVTLPLVLLLFDRWPLGRTDRSWQLVREKLDLFALAAGSSVVTVLAQRAGGALGSLETYPFGARAVNAVVACAAYLAKTVWPVDLAAFYPHPGAAWDPLAFGIALAVLVASSVCVFLARRARPYLRTGWLWYFVTLLPVLGIVQVGLQSMADRYTYVPLVGVFLIVAWGGHDVAARALQVLDERMRDRYAGALAAAVVILLGTAAARQAGYWRDGVALFERTLAVTEDNAVAENNLGSALYRRRRPGDLDLAVAHYRESVRIHPRYHVAYNNLGGALRELGRLEEAKQAWRRALELKSDYVAAACNLAGAQIRTGEIEDALQVAERALAADPRAACAHYDMALAHLARSRPADALPHLESAVELDPDSRDSRFNLAVVLARQGRLQDALEQFERLLLQDPTNADARANLERVRRALRERGQRP